MNDPGQFAIPKAAVEGFEASEFLHNGCGDWLAPAGTDDLRVLGKEPEGALCRKRRVSLRTVSGCVVSAR